MRTFKYRWSSAFGLSFICHGIILGAVAGLLVLFPPAQPSREPIEVDLVSDIGGGEAAVAEETPKPRSFRKSTKPKPPPRRRLRQYRQRLMKRRPTTSMKLHSPRIRLRQAHLPPRTALPLPPMEAAAAVEAAQAPVTAPVQEAAPAPAAAVEAAAAPVMETATAMAAEAARAAAAEKPRASRY